MEQWKKVWGYVPIDFGTLVGTAEELTQKIHIRNNLNGTEVRIKFSNLYDKETLYLEEVYVGKIDRGTKAIRKTIDKVIGKTKDKVIDKTIDKVIDKATDKVIDKASGQVTEVRRVTYQGNGQIAVPAGQAFYSDSIPLPLKEKEDLVVAVYFKGKHAFYSLCQTWNAGSWQSSFFRGNQAESPELSGMSTVEAFPFFAYDEHICNGVFGVSGVQVLTDEDITTVACFGDSITHMSYYFDPLQELLYQKYPGKISLLNCGIGGNRVLYDASYVKEMPGCGRCFGRAGQERFIRDVYEDAAPDIVFLMEGVNDCNHAIDFGLEGQVPTGAMIFEGLRSIIEKAHEKNSRVYISTVMPFANEDKQVEGQAENIRQELNTLIRAHKDEADGFVDLDELVRRPENMHFMKDGLHLGDGLHPNEAGGKMIADAVAGLI